MALAIQWIEPPSSGSDTWVNQDNWKKLVAGILPAGRATPEVGYDCQRMEWDKDYNKVAVCDAKTWPKQALPR